VICPHCGAPQSAQATAAAISDGAKGWSWGAFLLNWIWAIGNKTWIGLLALVPYVGFIMTLVLGFKGRELMASLDDARKPTLKCEQIAWIKEKESKCAKAGKEAEGGSMEGILINDCKIAMTEERVAYLHAYQ